MLKTRHKQQKEEIMSSYETPNLIQINGYCAEGYQPLKELFVNNFHTGKENNAQLCIYVNDECVVDLYGTAIGDASYTQDSIQVKTYFHY